MERSASHGRGRSFDQGAVISRDPRRAKSFYTSSNDSGLSTVRERDTTPREQQSTARDDNTSSTNTNISKANNPSLPPANTHNLQATLSAAISAGVKSGLAQRQREDAQARLKNAEAAYEETRQFAAQFPIISEQAQQKKKRFEVLYESAEQAASDCIAAEKSSTNALFQAIIDAIAKEGIQRGGQTDHEGVHRREIADLQIQQSKENEELHSQITQLAREIEDIRTQQRSRNKEPEIVSLKAHDELAAEHQRLRQSFNALQEQVGSMKEADRDLQTMQDSGSEAFESTVAELRKELNESIEQLRLKLNATEQVLDNFERHRKSSHLKLENIYGEITAFGSRLKTTQDDMSSVKADLGTLKSEQANVRGSSEDSTTTKRYIETEMNKVTDLVSSLQREIQAQSAGAQAFDQSLKKLEENSKSLDTNLSYLKTQHSKSSAEYLDKVSVFLADKLGEFGTKRDVTDGVRDAVISDEIKRLENLVAEQRLDILDVCRDIKQLRTTWDKRPAPHALSNEDRKAIEDAAVNNSKHLELERRFEDDHKRVEKHEHMVQALSHRFDNLTSEELSRQMLAVITPALPKFEQGLIHLEGEVRTLRALVEQSQTKVNGDVTESLRQMGSLQADLDEMKIKMTSDRESLILEFGKARDQLKDEINMLGNSNSRPETPHETFRDSVNDKIQALETIIGDMKETIEELLRASSRSRTARTTPDSSTWPVLMLNGKAQPTVDPKRTRANARGFRSKTMLDDVSYDDRGDAFEDSEPDDVVLDNESVRIAMIEKFKNRPASTLNGRGAVARKSPRKNQEHAHVPTKRKRSENLDDDIDPLALPDYSSSTRGPSRWRERRM